MEVSGFFKKKTQLDHMLFFWELSCERAHDVLLWTDTWEICVMFRKNISRIPQWKDPLSWQCHAMPHWSLLVVSHLHFIERNVPKNLLWCSDWFWAPLLICANALEPSDFCWIVPPLLICVWCLQLEYTPTILTTESGTDSHPHPTPQKTLLLNKATNPFFY